MAHRFAREVRTGKKIEDMDMFGPTVAVAGAPEFISSWGKHVDLIRFYFETCPYKRVTGLIWLGKLTFKALNTLASSGLMVPTPDMGSDPLMETR